jgi:hypothetical protein
MPSLAPIIPVVRREPSDDPAWLFDLKLDGFRGLTDTVAGRMVSKSGSACDTFALAIRTIQAYGPERH